MSNLAQNQPTQQGEGARGREGEGRGRGGDKGNGKWGREKGGNGGERKRTFQTQQEKESLAKREITSQSLAERGELEGSEVGRGGGG